MTYLIGYFWNFLKLSLLIDNNCWRDTWKRWSQSLRKTLSDILSVVSVFVSCSNCEGRLYPNSKSYKNVLNQVLSDYENWSAIRDLTVSETFSVGGVRIKFLSHNTMKFRIIICNSWSLVIPAVTNPDSTYRKTNSISDYQMGVHEMQYV